MTHNTYLMRNYPKIKRNISDRKSNITDQDRQKARNFDKDFFDGDRRYGYGGYKYDGRWVPVVKDFIDYYNLDNNSSILDIGAGKGFMIKDFKDALPDANVRGIDISQYAVQNSMQEIKDFMSVGDAKKLEFDDKSFDLVISINTVHNLPLDECKFSLKEITRVSKKNSFIVVDSWNNKDEELRMKSWNLTALTYMSASSWEKLFSEVGYKGDYDWFIP
jgi:ubiquinone/menaquinone biosynthesis C-methylase UbiE